jgi:hypothetical protein
MHVLCLWNPEGDILSGRHPGKMDVYSAALRLVNHCHCAEFNSNASEWLEFNTRPRQKLTRRVAPKVLGSPSPATRLLDPGMVAMEVKYRISKAFFTQTDKS